jgi:hypothetical protein
MSVVCVSFGTQKNDGNKTLRTGVNTPCAVRPVQTQTGGRD